MTAPTTNPRFAEIESHRGYLVRYALSQLRDPQLAEEAVQEALLAALEGIGQVRRPLDASHLATSILRFKVIDIQRRLMTERANVAIDDERLGRGPRSVAGRHVRRDRPLEEARRKAWNDPEASLEQRRFWEAFEMCLADFLPRRAACSSSARSWARTLR
jgi:RNA polymerase sigma-70 factor (ECF subfamily)